MARVPDEELIDLRAKAADYDKVAPYLDLAERIAGHVGRLGAAGGTEPPAGVDRAIAEATQRVRDEEVAGLTDRYTTNIRREKRAQIAAEVAETLGPSIKQAVEADFTANEEPALREAIARETEREARNATLQDLRARRPGEIRAEILAANEDKWRTEEETRFAKNEEPDLRAKAAVAAQSNITTATRERIRKEIADSAKNDAEALIREQEAAKLALRERLTRIKDKARMTDRIEFGDLRTNDVLIIELAERGDAHSTTTPGKKASRILRVSVRDETNGVAMILDDSWQKGTPLERETSIEDGTIVQLGTAIRHHDTQPDPATSQAITRGVGLRITIGKEEALTAGYEVNRVIFKTDAEPQVILANPSEITPDSTARRNY